MGLGEAFVMAWSKWWDAQNFGEEQRIAYFRPPPPRWLEWMIGAIWGGSERNSAEDLDYITHPISRKQNALGSAARKITSATSKIRSTFYCPMGLH